MGRILGPVLGLALALAGAANARADGAPSAREVQAAVDGYLAGGPDARLVGGPGSAGYDHGFWIRGGDFSLRINLTLQARYEAFDFDEDQPPETGLDPVSGGDLSGFSLPRATLKFSGTAPCSICWYLELEFGHYGEEFATGGYTGPSVGGTPSENLGPWNQSFNFDNSREAWIEWCYCPAFNVRTGQVKTPTTRQLMVAPELQQFVDISLASICTGQHMPGYTDRNRDHGVLFHGAFGCANEWSYILGVTNGDGGDSIRNVLDPRTSDGLAYSARINWAFLEPIGYQEGALGFTTCTWYGEVGAWGYLYGDRTDKSHRNWGDHTRLGVDLALGYGGFSFTGAATWEDVSEAFGGDDWSSLALLVQLGFHFPGTAWEVAARWSLCDGEYDYGPFTEEFGLSEIAFGVNYYLNGHGNKLQLDLSIFSAEDLGILPLDAYAGLMHVAYGAAGEDLGVLLRFQWQLAL